MGFGLAEIGKSLKKLSAPKQPPSPTKIRVIGFGSVESACCSGTKNGPTAFAPSTYTTGAAGLPSTGLGIASHVTARAGLVKAPTANASALANRGQYARIIAGDSF